MGGQLGGLLQGALGNMSPQQPTGPMFGGNMAPQQRFDMGAVSPNQGWGGAMQIGGNMYPDQNLKIDGVSPKTNPSGWRTGIWNQDQPMGPMFGGNMGQQNKRLDMGAVSPNQGWNVGKKLNWNSEMPTGPMFGGNMANEVRNRTNAYNRQGY